MSSTPLISVIIPIYNAKEYIAQTLLSVIKQTHANLEIICINDGSTDNSEEIVKSIIDERIQYIPKTNTGVSDTRNLGLLKAKGEYVIFLDADDLLSDQYLEKSLQLLEQNLSAGFCCSQVIKIDDKGNIKSTNHWKGTSTEILKEVLSYDQEIITCPSNYLYRKNVLLENSIFFNVNLSSSADRYFLIEVSNFTKGIFNMNENYMYYRVHKTSMSNHFTPQLINDNLLFQKMVLKIGNIPNSLKREFNFKTNYIFAGSFFRLKKTIPCIIFSLKAFYYNPARFIKQLTNKN